MVSLFQDAVARATGTQPPGHVRLRTARLRAALDLRLPVRRRPLGKAGTHVSHLGDFLTLVVVELLLTHKQSCQR